MIKFEDYFYYDESSKSKLRWKVKGKFQGDLRGKEAGGLDSKGYYRVSLNYKDYKVHRIVYYLFNTTFKYEDKMFIDHIDGIRSNNTISNLRLTDRAGNARNAKKPIRNKTGRVGVSLKSNQGLPTSYRATWRDLSGKPHEKYFSINKYGEELAFFMACEYREQMINLLNLQGAGYSENHGK